MYISKRGGLVSILNTLSLDIVKEVICWEVGDSELECQWKEWACFLALGERESMIFHSEETEDKKNHNVSVRHSRYNKTLIYLYNKTLIYLKGKVVILFMSRIGFYCTHIPSCRMHMVT